MTQAFKYVKFTENDLRAMTLENNWKGSGTIKDPLIIDSANSLPQELQITNSNLYLSFEGCNLNRLSLTGCHNITVSNCELDYHHIEKSSECTVKNSSIKKSLSVNHSSRIKVENCEISNLGLVKSFTNEINNSSINTVFMQFSRGNIFGETKIPETFQAMILKDSSNKLYLYILFIWISVLVSGFFMYQIEVYRTQGLGFSLLVFGCLFPLVLYAYIKNFREMKKYPPNQII